MTRAGAGGVDAEKKSLKATVKEPGTLALTFSFPDDSYRISRLPLHQRGAQTLGFSSPKLLLSDSLQL